MLYCDLHCSDHWQGALQQLWAVTGWESLHPVGYFDLWQLRFISCSDNGPLTCPFVDVFSPSVLRRLGKVHIWYTTLPTCWQVSYTDSR